MSGALTRLAARRLHVLLVEARGATAVRWAAEAELDRRGWVVAASAADADVVLVCGTPGPALAALADAVLDLLPRPADRAAAATPEEVGTALDGALARWATGGLPRAGRAAGAEDGDGDGDGGSGDGGSDDGGSDDDDGDDGGGMDMSGPGGVPLAGGAEDRDGLEMDVLHVPLGPVLPAWPAGLVLTGTLAGDVVTGAGVDVLPAAGPAPGAVPAAVPVRPPGGALRADLVARVLTLAGRADLAGRARTARGLLLAGDPSAAQRQWVRVGRAVGRSRGLRWSLRDVGALDGVLLAEHRVPAGLAGDVADRLAAALADPLSHPLDAEPLDAGSAGWPGPAPAGWRARLLGLLPGLVTGAELAGVRLVLASLPADLTAVVPEVEQVRHG
ncbi:hypothetical protein TEK04_10680 [Klenkia sp. LSe6-5]|uniref:Uncharacterized protein n=1 Tax=Klenkia sesuvii TaxID=3103137 RepID=A0ABU8DTK4_9ACTN